MDVNSEKIKNLNNWIYHPGHYSRSGFRQSINDLGLCFYAFWQSWKNWILENRKRITLGLFVFVGLSLSAVQYSLAATLFQIPYPGADYQVRSVGQAGVAAGTAQAENNWYFNTGNGMVKSFLSTNIISKVGSPSGNFCIGIYAHGTATTSQPDSGTLISSSCLASSSITGIANIGFPFSPVWIPSGTTTYSLVFYKDTAADASNYYTIKSAINNFNSFGYFQTNSASGCQKTNGAWDSTCTTKNTTDLFTGIFYSGTPVSDTLATSAQAFADAWNNFTSSTWNCSNSTSTSGQGFTDALSCAFTATGREILNFMFVPGTASRNAFSGSFGVLSSAFPFSLFFNVNDLIQSKINTGDFSTNQALKIPIQVNQYSSTTINITSSTFTNVVGAETMNLWFEFQKYLAWAIVMFLIFMILFKR